MDYQFFGDVFAFGATYKKNKHRLSIVIFFGVNNHKQTIVFTTTVIANETNGTYIWLLEQFLEVTKGKTHLLSLMET